MRFTLTFLIVSMAVAFPYTRAQTLGESVVAGNEDGAAWQTDTLGDSVVAGNEDGAAWETDSIAASLMGDVTDDDLVTDDDGTNDISSTEASGVGTVSPPDDLMIVDANSTSDDGSTDDTTGDDDGTPSQSNDAVESGSSGASRPLFAASATLVAVAIAAML
uniref:RxLR effector candidate protein n=1 Tax=Hyaloperonospora arabidopsidis (strain Emoy2) TaxID=559515 RepID=M4BCK6_HYAAE